MENKDRKMRRREGKVRLTLISGPEQLEYIFEERSSCILGRAKGCFPGFPADKAHRIISRHHCLLDINPPEIVVRDLGSRGGTFVNGQLIGQRPEGMDPGESRKLVFPEVKLKDGDELKLCKKGTAIFRVNIVGPPIPATRTCPQCGRDVSAEAGAEGPGAFVCTACRKNPESFFSEQKSGGKRVVPALRGYRIQKKLDKGGQGSVWLAKSERTGDPVAVKVMLPKVAADERAIDRFLREMASNRVLNHRHVVRLFSSGFARGTFYIVLE